MCNEMSRINLQKESDLCKLNFYQKKKSLRKITKKKQYPCDVIVLLKKKKIL